jgi:CheY-like chemotaxis protein/anti-sigma regulatory factor (Ser/Thr protein kinase)
VQTLQNLLDNALKYTEEGGVTLSLFQDASGAIRIVVQDTGIGISEEYLPLVFEPYSQEESGYSRSFEGMGLGLSLVKKYAELIGAQLRIESKKGIGTIVTMEFENRGKVSTTQHFAAADPTSLQVSSEEQTEEEHPAILVVEDDVLTVQYMTTLLKKEFNIDSAASGREAWGVLHGTDIDLILMDLSLSGDTSGLELTREIRSTQRHASLPIIAVTAHSLTYDRERCLAAGCNAFILKPAKQDELIGIIQSLLVR